MWQLSNNLYRSAIGSLLYLSNYTRPDITVAVSIISRKVSCPTQQDWNEVKRILKYLIGTLNLKFCVAAKYLKLIGYANADWLKQHKNFYGCKCYSRI